MHVNTQILESRLKTATIPELATIISELKAFVLEARDVELVHINPRRLARKRGLEVMSTLKSFLYLTKAGVFDLRWSVHCPHCQGESVNVGGLDLLHERGHCAGCQTDFQAGFDQNVELSFRINPSVAELGELDPLAVQSQGFELEPGITMDLEPGESHFIEMFLKPGNYGLVALNALAIVNLPISALDKSFGDPGPRNVEILCGPQQPPLRFINLVEGEHGITVRNEGPETAQFLFARVLSPEWTDAALVSTLQEFRDLFAKEMLSADQAFAIRNLSLVFTDIKGSTEMYERLGDAKAFYLVKEHFKIMEEVVRAQNGGIVKTIGDAVMAVFNTPRQALEASCRMIDAFDEFNRQEHIDNEIIVKIGIHLGPCIPVTLSDRLDYFGSTVNIAAHIHGLSNGPNIIASERLYHQSGS